MSNVVETKVSRRYAQALFSIAQDKSAVKEYLEQWRAIVEAINASAELTSIFYGRLYNLAAKKSLADKLFAGAVSQEVLNFLQVVLDKGRESFMEDILANYQSMTDELFNTDAVTVVSAAPLSEAQQAALGGSIKKQTGRDIRITGEVDAALLGGLKVIIGDKHYDASVAGQLSSLKQQLTR